MKVCTKTLCSLALSAAILLSSMPAAATVDTSNNLRLTAQVKALLLSDLPPGSPPPTDADIVRLIGDVQAGMADPQVTALVNAASRRLEQDAAGSQTALMLGFISTFAFGNKIDPDPNNVLTFSSVNFIAALINPDPVMAFHLSFHNTAVEDALLTFSIVSDISPVLTFADSPVVNATVEAAVTDLGGVAGATADVAVDFFTIEGGFNVSTGLAFNGTVTETTPGSFTGVPVPRNSFDPITGFQTSVLATIASGDLLDLKVTYGIGGDPVPLVDNAIAQQMLADSVAAATTAGEQEPEPVPLPASAALMLAGIAGLGVFGVRRKRR